MNIQCRNCTAAIQVPQSLYGQIIECPTCGGQIQMPSVQDPDEESIEAQIVDQAQNKRCQRRS